MINPGNRAQDSGSLTYTSAPMTELNGRRRTKSGDTLGQGEVESESQAHASVRDNEHMKVCSGIRSIALLHLPSQIPLHIPLACL
jgi:urate oxidase